MAKYFLTGGLAGPWKKEKVTTKPVYEFGFTLTRSGDNISIAADEGVTYEAIRAALDKTPLVFARTVDSGAVYVTQINTIYDNDQQPNLQTQIMQCVSLDPVTFSVAITRLNSDDAIDFVYTLLESAT